MAHRTSSQALWVVVFRDCRNNHCIADQSGIAAVDGRKQGNMERCERIFFIINCPLLFRGSLIVYGNILRANKDSKTPLYINLSVNILNIMLNQLLIGTGTAFVLFGEK